jgi:GxxExxY protein
MADYQALPEHVEEIAGEVVDAAFQVHRELGPGLLERIYELCLDHELSGRGLRVDRQVPIPILYKDTAIDADLRLDMLVGNNVIVEVKSVAELLPVHQAQLLTYLKLSGHRLGFLINFNVHRFKTGIKRMIR